MTNFQVYKKTLGFSFLRFLADLASLAMLGGVVAAGYFIANGKGDGAGLIGAIVGFVVGLILLVVFDFFVNTRIKAAQISMMTKGVVDGKLPEHCVTEGFNNLRGRFSRLATFYLITRIIKGIFNQLSRTFNRIGTAIGGDVGNGVTSAINSAVQTVIAYLCDCCLGWILYRQDVNPFKAGAEGCVIFFKHGKALVKNVGRIFGMGLLSLIVIGGAFFGLTYLVLSSNPQLLTVMIEEFKEIAATDGGVPPDVFTNPFYLSLMISGFVGLVFFGILHSILVKPFILVGVLKNYMNAGLADLPKESDFATLAEKSPKFRQLQSRIE